MVTRGMNGEGKHTVFCTHCREVLSKQLTSAVLADRIASKKAKTHQCPQTIQGAIRQ